MPALNKRQEAGLAPLPAERKMVQLKANSHASEPTTACRNADTGNRGLCAFF
jgi:hypothetical protein